MDQKQLLVYHNPGIPRPQLVYEGFSNDNEISEPFIHHRLEKSSDGQTYIHPLEKYSVSDFVDDVDNEPVKPACMEKTPYTLVEDIDQLKILAEKLKCVDVFAVDLEHNSYRSFQGMTCLLQISTRQEDYIVDTLKLRSHVGPQLREVFEDPKKKKVMHGAVNDILWLQRDFGIYLCNLFDTHEASQVLNLEKNSLEFLLLHFCGVTVNKAYQNADWRLRPLPVDMIKYAREDTHYLLYIHDRMRLELQTASTGASDPSNLFKVYKQSYNLCMRLYEKRLHTSISYLNIFGLKDANFNSRQLSIVRGLYEWRDVVARNEDESYGYIMPNNTILNIARQMPPTVDEVTKYGVNELLKHSAHHYDPELDIITQIIKDCIKFESDYEMVTQQKFEPKVEITNYLPESEYADDEDSCQQ